MRGGCTSLGTTAKSAAARGVPEGGSAAARGVPEGGSAAARRGGAVQEALAAAAGSSWGALKWRLQRVAQGLLRHHRVAHCQRSVTREGVDVWRTEAGAHYAGVVTCGSVWHCPVCAPKIAEGRRQDLDQAVRRWVREGGEVYLATFTFRHHQGDRLAEVVKAFQDALRRLTSWRGYKRLLADAGAVGAVRALEVTHGENGWHPHVHMLIFARRGALEVLQEIEALWLRALRRCGLDGVVTHAYDVRGGNEAARYVAKYGHEPHRVNEWNAASELTHGQRKRARLKGRTPFGLLLDAAQGDREAARLFQDYAEVFHGRRQLYWSPKLRERLGLGAEASDADLARDQVGEADELVVTLTLHDWAVVLRHNARWELLRVAELHGRTGVERFLDRLRRSPGTHQGRFSMRAHYGPGWVELDPIPGADRVH